ncbi:MAG: metallophosphoesterase [Candidatus Symbiothrix sp.]|jgi:predicted MPP superfamily phosphohydrolase|nr:metallophosphoesterase [Candidatus Symbiothrix sp.]
MGFFVVVFLVHTAINAYLFYRGWGVVKTLPKPAKIGYCVVFAVLYLAFLTAMSGRNILPLGVQKILYSIGTVWMGYMLYLTAYFLITDLGYGVKCRVKGIRCRVKGIRCKVKGTPYTFYPTPFTLYRRVQVISGYVLVSLLLLYGNYQFNHPKIVEKEIVLNKGIAGQARNDSLLEIADAGASLAGARSLKIVAVSDFHLGVQIDKKKLQKYVQLINAQQPDVIVIAGDLVDNNALPLNLEKMEEEINQLQAPLGVYFCLGNHEYLSGIDASEAFLKKTNLIVLKDSVATIAGGVQIIGRDDKQGNPNRLSLKQIQGKGCKVKGEGCKVKDENNPAPCTLHPVPCTLHPAPVTLHPSPVTFHPSPCTFHLSPVVTILLDHEPYNLEETEAAGIDLQFSGHTHHGQIFPFNKLVEHLFEVAYGYKQKGKTGVYVTSGIGLWGPPFRIGTQSEIVVVKLVIN